MLFRSVNGTLNRFAYTWYIQHLPAFQAFKSPAGFNSKFHDEEKVWDALTHYALKDSIDLRSVPAKDKITLEHRLKGMLAQLIWRTEGLYEVINNYDPAFAKALEVVSK